MEDSDKLLIAAKKLWDKNIQNKSVITNERLWIEQIERYKKMFNIFQAGEYYYMMFDLLIGDVASVSNEVTNVLGYEPKEFNSQLLFDIIHPDDRVYLINFEKITTQFINPLPVEEYPYYKYQYDLRFRTKKNIYKRILVQYQVVDYDSSNVLQSFHIHTDISHIKPEGEPCVSIVGIEGRPSYYNIKNFTLTKSFDLFTKREREILKSIVEGKTSQQIADEFFISLYTVNAHRRNIMEKAGVKTPIELVKKCLNGGWI